MREMVQRQPQSDQCHIQELGRKLQASIHLDRKRLSDTTGEEVESLHASDPPLHKRVMDPAERVLSQGQRAPSPPIDSSE